MTAASGKWGDLGPRVASAVAMVAIGAVEVWLGGVWFKALASLLTGLMIWELARMTAPEKQTEAHIFGLLAAGLMAIILADVLAWGWLAVLVVPILGLVQSRKIAPAFAIYALALQLAVIEIVAIRDDAGVSMVLWLLGVVIASDVMGYFAGRMLGGPKFWPSVSPKKTWSGTIAGWVGAAGVGLLFMSSFAAAGLLVLISVFTAFAGQLGDIAESAIKRAVGFKDSSGLIPGHGGILDRFDALIGAALFLALLRATLGVSW